MDEDPLPHIQPHMAHPPAPRGEEEEVPRPGLLQIHRAARLELGLGRARQPQSVQPVDRPREARAVEPPLRGAPEQVGHAQVALGRVHQAGPQAPLVLWMDPGTAGCPRRRSIRCHHPESLDHPGGLQGLAPGPGRLPGG